MDLQCILHSWLVCPKRCFSSCRVDGGAVVEFLWPWPSIFYGYFIGLCLVFWRDMTEKCVLHIFLRDMTGSLMYYFMFCIFFYCFLVHSNVWCEYDVYIWWVYVYLLDCSNIWVFMLKTVYFHMTFSVIVLIYICVMYVLFIFLYVCNFFAVYFSGEIYFWILIFYSLDFLTAFVLVI